VLPRSSTNAPSNDAVDLRDPPQLETADHVLDAAFQTGLSVIIVSTVSGSDATSPHRTIHAATSPQFSGTR
jgi:methylmalonyl-CoA mutase cobalamin-binding subunit